MPFRSTPFWLFTLNFAAVFLALTIYALGGRDHFGERGFITFLSTFQLLAIAWISHRIARVSHRYAQNSGAKSSVLWRVISWGFVFLAADEFLSIHEVTDLLIHDIFNWETTGLSDRIDDLIIALYGIMSIGLLWRYRDELKTHKAAIALFKKGFILLFVMIGLDVLANEQDLLEIFFAPDTANTIQRHLDHLEDALKVFAEVFFILAFVAILKAKQFQQKRWQQSSETVESSAARSPLPLAQRDRR